MSIHLTTLRELYRYLKFKPTNLVTKTRVLCLNYHVVTDQFDENECVKGIWSSTKDFINAAKALRAEAISIVSVQDAQNILANSQEGTFACITVDDGHCSNVNVAEIAEYYSIPVTLFINGAYLNDADVNIFAASSWYYNNLCKKTET